MFLKFKENYVFYLILETTTDKSVYFEFLHFVIAVYFKINIYVHKQNSINRQVLLTYHQIPDKYIIDIKTHINMNTNIYASQKQTFRFSIAGVKFYILIRIIWQKKTNFNAIHHIRKL